MKQIKKRTYYNFMRVVRLLEAKGYDQKEAGEITRLIFDEYEAAPKGLTVLQRVDRILSKAEYEKEYPERSAG